MVKKRVKIPETYNYISAFLTMRCNLNCSFCLNAFSKSFNRKGFKEIGGKEWVEALNKIESSPEVPVTLSGGEPGLHKDFIYILNHLKKELNIDILTNLHWGESGIEKFVSEVNPERLKRNSPYASIRASYHPEQMGTGEKLIENAKKLKDVGFNIGIYYVAHPSKKESELVTQMQFRCLDNGIDFRRKDFTGKFGGVDDLGREFSVTYGDYSRYPDSAFNEKTKECLCKTSELLIGPDGNVYRCHRDLYAEENPVGNITSDDFEIVDVFRKCDKYGQCHPCDVKVKTNYKQKLGHTSVKIENIKDKN